MTTHTDTTIPPPEIHVAPDGTITGIDGMLHQMAGAVMVQARDVLLPALRDDRQFTGHVGEAVGRGIGEELWPWAALGAGALTATAVFSFLRWRDQRQTRA